MGGLHTQKAQQGLKLDTFITKIPRICTFASSFQPKDVYPDSRCLTCSNIHCFLRANIARMNKSRPNPLSQQQQRRFTSMKPTNVTNSCKSGCKETPACPVVTYLSIISVFSLVMLTNFQHSPTLHPQSR